MMMDDVSSLPLLQRVHRSVTDAIRDALTFISQSHGSPEISEDGGDVRGKEGWGGVGWKAWNLLCRSPSPRLAKVPCKSMAAPPLGLRRPLSNSSGGGNGAQEEGGASR